VRPTFELTCTVTLEEVPEIRRLVERVHRRFVPNRDDISRVAMATHELLENAIKFSTDGTATIRIEVPDEGEIRITTRNRARSDDLEGLQRIAAELEASPDPMLYYIGLMQKSPDRRGGLGIGRVAAEGEMAIALELDGDVVEVSARAGLAKAA
jgi:anti-sigma regulatory factor (Ser/Thr protein kinase)